MSGEGWEESDEDTWMSESEKLNFISLYSFNFFCNVFLCPHI